MVFTSKWLRGFVGARKWLGRYDITHLMVLVATIVVTWVGLLAHMQHEYDQDEAEAWRASANIVRGLDENLARTIGGIDQTLLFLRELHRRDPAALDLTGWAQDPYWTAGPVIQISVNDRTGQLKASNLTMPDTPVNVSNRAHFTVQRDATDDRLYISVPVLGRVSGRWTVNLTRRLQAADGSFDGIVKASMDIGYLDQVYSAMQIKHGMMLLVGTDGMVRQRAPSNPTAIGREATGSERNLLSGHRAGTFRAADPVDGVERMVSYKMVGNLPLVIAIGLDVDAVFADWTISRRNHLLVALFLSAMAILAFQSLQRQRERRHASQAALGVTLANMSQGILMVDAAGRIGVVNDRAIALVGLPPGMFHAGSRFRDLLQWQLDQGEFGPPDQVDPAFIAFVQLGGLATEYGVYERTRANGVVLEVRTALLPDGGAVRTFTDLSHRKHTELELAAARDSAEADGRARAEFLAVMSHEIRTPMNGIIGVSSLLLEMEMGPSERRYVQIIMDSGQHLLQLINDILDFSRLDAGRLDLEDAEFDLPAMLRATLDMLASDAQRKGLGLSLDIAADVPQFAIGDAHRLRQILLNLLGNGLKFTSAGRVTLTVRRVGHGPGSLRLSFAISDTGIGIPTDEISKLFTEFTQVDSSITRRFGGSGLGLAISRRLVERMGGVIWVDSTLGSGSVFQFEITFKQPQEHISASIAPSPAGIEAASPAALHILLADDNDTNRLVTTKLLERRGHVVVAVANGREAVDRARTIAFNLVLMDMMMPEMDGLAATRAIRQLGEPFGTVPIIGLTASVTAADEAACREAGMVEFAPKPINASQLAALVIKVARAPFNASHATDEADFNPVALARLDPPTAHAKARAFIAACRRDGNSLQDLADSQQMAQLSQLALQISINASELGLPQLALSTNWLAATAEAGAPVGSRLADTVTDLKAASAAVERWLSTTASIPSNHAT